MTGQLIISLFTRSFELDYEPFLKKSLIIPVQTFAFSRSSLVGEVIFVILFHIGSIVTILFLFTKLLA